MASSPSELFPAPLVLQVGPTNSAAGRGVYPVQKDRLVALLSGFVRLRARRLAHLEGSVRLQWSNPFLLGGALGLTSSFRASWPWQLSSICAFHPFSADIYSRCRFMLQ